MSQSDAKAAQPDHPIHPLLAARWSPYAFEPVPVEDEKLLAGLEAARWAASSFNEQPWSFIVGRRQEPESFQRLVGCLVDANQQWAANAGVLLLTVAKRTFTRNGKPNRVAEHDVALAIANLTVQATASGLAVHQMAGINIAKARQTYNIPEGYDPLTAVALGYRADPAHYDDQELAQRDTTGRTRKPLREFVFGDEWAKPAPVVL